MLLRQLLKPNVVGVFLSPDGPRQAQWNQLPTEFPWGQSASDSQSCQCPVLCKSSGCDVILGPSLLPDCEM